MLQAAPIGACLGFSPHQLKFAVLPKTAAVATQKCCLFQYRLHNPVVLHRICTDNSAANCPQKRNNHCQHWPLSADLWAIKSTETPPTGTPENTFFSGSIPLAGTILGNQIASAPCTPKTGGGKNFFTLNKSPRLFETMAPDGASDLESHGGAVRKIANHVVKICDWRLAQLGYC